MIKDRRLRRYIRHNKVKLFLIVLLGFLVGLALGLYLFETDEVNAKPRPQCKQENAECEINNSRKVCCEGLVCVPFNIHSGNGKCKYPVTPTPTPTCEPTPTPEPTPTDEPEPTPTEAPKQVVVHSTSASTPQCTSTRPVLLPANPLVWRKAGQAIVQWQPTEGDNANVYYREVSNYDNAHAVRDTENDGYVEIDLLGSLDWEFGIQQANDCAGGDTVWIVDGSTNAWYLFTL